MVGTKVEIELLQDVTEWLWVALAKVQRANEGECEEQRMARAELGEAQGRVSSGEREGGGGGRGHAPPPPTHAGRMRRRDDGGGGGGNRECDDYDDGDATSVKSDRSASGEASCERNGAGRRMTAVLGGGGQGMYDDLDDNP